MIDALAVKWRQEMATWVVRLGGALDRIDDMMHAITEDAQTVQEKAQKITETACEAQELGDQRLHHYEMKAARLLDVVENVGKRASHLRPLTFAFGLWYILLSLVIGTYLEVTVVSST
jgi:hypothetical protein